MKIFPEHTEEIDNKYYTFTSGIYVLVDKGETVDVYLYPVISTYVIKNRKLKKQFLLQHLKECLRLTKYIDLETLDFRVMALVTSLDKDDPKFLEKIHYKYL